MVIIKEIEKEGIDVTWYCNKWISFKFFDDALLFVDKESELGKKIFLLNEFKLDTLNLMQFKNIENQFKQLLEGVINYNKKTQGTDMHDPSYFQMYYDKLLELKKMFYETYNITEVE